MVQSYGMPYGTMSGPAAGQGGMGGPQGSQYYNTVQSGGRTIDQYMIPGEMRAEQYQVPMQTMQTVMDTHVEYEERTVTIQVPKTVMEDVEITYQVPAMDTKTHTLQRPKTVMENREITVQEPRTVMERGQVQVPSYVMTQQTQIKHKVIEYERPKMVPGRYVRTVDAPMQQQMYTSGVPTQQMYTTGQQAYTTGMPYGQPMQQGYGSYVQSVPVRQGGSAGPQ